MKITRLAVIAFVLALSLRAEENAQQKFMQLEREVHTLFQQKKYEEAAGKCSEQLTIAPKNSNAHYNLACAQARLSKTDDAFKSLQAAIDNGFADVGHMRADDDLNSLHADARFEKMMTAATEKEKTSFERGAEIKGVKTIDDFPEARVGV